MVALNFNATNVKPAAGYEPVPTGQYRVMIVSSEEKPTKDGNGSYIQLDMAIQDPGEHFGKKITDRLNINNKNQTAVDIAYATLSAICHVTGRLNIQDTQQLHGVPFVAQVSKVKRTDGEHASNPNSYSNEIKGYKDINGNDPGFAGNTQGGGNGQAAGAAPSWAGGGNTQGQPAQGQPAQGQPQQPQQTNTAPQGQPSQPQGNAGGAPATDNTPPWARGNG